MIKFILKSIIGNLFKGFTKTIKWILIVVFFLGMLFGFPIILFAKAMIKRKHDKEQHFYD